MPNKGKNKPYEPRSIKSGYKIPPKSKNAVLRQKDYENVKRELRTELKAKNEWFCFFCGKPMGKEKNFHHTHGRIGKFLTDKKYLKPAHDKCHVEDYHGATAKQLKAQPWYEEFLQRLKELDENLYLKELKKQTK